MDAKFPLLLLPAVLLLAGAPAAFAESPIDDPFAPAVAGRPLHQIAPARSVRPKPMTLRPGPARHAAARPAVTAKAPKGSKVQNVPKVAKKPAPAVQARAMGAAPAVAMAAPAAAAAMPVTQELSGSQRAAKQTLDDRFDSSVQFSEVGKGTHFARKALAPGAFFGDRHRTAVHKYYDEHPVSGRAAIWRIGERVPRGAAVKAVPGDLVPSLPNLPPGYRYAQLGGDVVMIAEGSKMVVDGISRSAR
ncbi:MAG TPA: hypothetical protein VF522_12450 [Ramlibacter sp.]|uniref:hypothetical protein n=1 Tax=Ramlibacter sp. TaxID=1917967 RepID=UPI002ED44EC5